MQDRDSENSKPDQSVLCEMEFIHFNISFEGFGFLCFVFFLIFYSIFNSQLFPSLAEHQINFAEMLRSRGSINGETSGNLGLAGRFPNCVSQKSCRVTLASQSLINDKKMRKYKRTLDEARPNGAATSST